MSVNSVTLVGRLGKDPDKVEFSNGSSLVNLSVATHENYKDSKGSKQTKTTWHNVVLVGKRGDLALQFLKKGSQVYVEGKIQVKTWETKDGEKRSKTEIYTKDIQFLDPRNEDSGDEIPF